MTITEKAAGKIALLDFSGKIMGGPDAGLLNDKLHELIDQNKTRIVVDLGNVDWMNSSGLGVLIQALNTMRNNGGDIKLANVTERIKSLLMITKLTRIFEIFDTVEDAVASFN
ncbi:MAG: STAS domain-containing protein [candidate division KSB1 bacterium]